MKEEDIPEEVFESIKRINEERGISVEKMVSEYEKILNEDKIRKWVEKQEVSDSEKLKTAGKMLFTRFMSKEPVTTYSMVIPFGIKEEPHLKKGAEDKTENMRSALFAKVRISNDKPFETKEIVFTGENAIKIQKIRMMRAYSNVKLYDKGFFMEYGDDTKFDTSQKLKMSEDDFILKICKLPKLDKLSDVVTHRSKREDSGYIDRKDMYLIEGMVQRGFKKGYAIKDESLPYEEKPIKIDSEDIILPQTLTVWVPSRFYRWNEESELAFLGTIDVGRKDNKPFMNAVFIYPAGFVEEIPEGGKK